MSIRSKSYRHSSIIRAETLLTKRDPLTNLNSLSAVAIGAAEEQDLLRYDSGTSKWTNIRNPLIQSYVRVGSNSGSVIQITQA